MSIQRIEMKTIWKFPIEIKDEQLIKAPFGAEVIHAGLDPLGVPCVWCEVESVNSPDPISIVLVGTGQELPPRTFTHRGSFVDGAFVWHVYAYDFTQ